MKQALAANIFIWAIMMDFSICNYRWSAKFVKKKSRITDESWQIFSFEDSRKSEFWCLDKCRDNIYCAYVVFKLGKCILYSEFAVNNLQNSSIEFVYEKISNKLVNLNCSGSDKYWSLKQKKCLMCQNGFYSYSIWPYACYFTFSSNFNFLDARLKCENIEASLISPKSKIEMNLITEMSFDQGVWINSMITAANEIYKWDDGTKVGGFLATQPNYGAGEVVLSITQGGFYDDQINQNKKAICQIN